MTDQDKLDRLLKHQSNVKANCEKLGKLFIAKGLTEIGRRLIANGQIHDNSKFHGIEWDFLDPEATNKQGLKLAINQHHRTNPHHPEYWGAIEDMPNLYLAEMVCDWKARGEEMGNGIREYIDYTATKRWKFNKDSKVYATIMAYVDMICDKPFINVEEPVLEDIKT